MTNEQLIKTALESGADNAAIIFVDDINFRPEFRDACEVNHCGKFGKCWMCPPDVGDIDKLIAYAKRYSNAVVFQTIGKLDDSFDIEGMEEAAKRHNNVIQGISNEVKKVLIDPLILGAGACHVCDKCAKIDEHECLYPNKAIASLEAYGIAVSELAGACELKYINGENTVTYFGAILFNEEDR
jgi:predicted metal-binding protein